jgi:hypothetical protein
MVVGWILLRSVLVAPLVFDEGVAEIELCRKLIAESLDLSRQPRKEFFHERNCVV